MSIINRVCIKAGGITSRMVETSIYSSNLEKMKEFYVDKLGLDFVSEQKGRHVLLKPIKNMLLIFNHEITTSENETNNGAPTLPSMVHIVFEIEPGEYEKAEIASSEQHYSRNRNRMGE